ncbi:MAG TPA: M17 family peptidase N-terminal domain-containing protein [Candidatus Limnocylindrales bacterium]
MQTRAIDRQPWDVDADILVVPIPSELEPDDVTRELDRRQDGALAAYRSLGEQTGKAHSAIVVRGRETGAPWLMALGVGKAADIDRLAAVRLGSAVERRLAGRHVARVAIWLPAWLTAGDDLDQRTAAELVTRGVVEGMHDPATIYRDDVESTPPVLTELMLVVPGADTAVIGAAMERGRVIGEGTNRARRLSERAANDVSPEVLADEATTIAAAHDLTIDVIGPEEATALGMHLFMAVGRGSDNPPRFIVMRSGDADALDSRGRRLAMVGKGVTFDSGGISIKPADKMEEMKTDKTGACTVISAIATAATLAPGLPLMAVAPAVENLPGPHSTRPGDIVRALNGKVVEIQNTDAEGRLILGDALTWAERNGATHLVDVATLTGAVQRALGTQITGGFGTPQAWWDEIVAAGERQGERYWQLPLVADYRKDLETFYAELNNSAGPDGSLVKSGVFLSAFATKPWVHLDIGGSGYARKATPYAARGATGVTHATLVELALLGA